MLGRETPPKAGHSGEIVGWNGVRNDEDSVVSPVVIEELNGKLTGLTFSPIADINCISETGVVNRKVRTGA
jgi:hypothetical protein